MAKYIDADALAEWIDWNFYEPQAMKILKAVKSAKGEYVAPVRHGEWNEEPFLLGITRRCSVCGLNYGMPHEVFRFCPNCGSKMGNGNVAEEQADDVHN